ncbi:hypothetical protein HMPREF9180_0489 [Streptococcus peroris ATCC 700780]|uniref:HTH cro/C1-type domain-containing protein n=1 Tax=Streptococcus peroris ATCC 700780 TaxID=888746 RepID=E8KAI4_9STRE|nr:hypothetical protein HMPREF9180_0489 [Streptococcus peroris ATCC 700780]
MWLYTQYEEVLFLLIIKLKELITIISFSPLWDTMKKKEISQYRLLKSGIDNKTLDSLKKNKNITLLTLEKLCCILDCLPNDIVEFIEETPDYNQNQ